MQGAKSVDPVIWLLGGLSVTDLRKGVSGKQCAQSSMRWVRMGCEEDERSRDFKNLLGIHKKGSREPAGSRVES